jgi:hypothetical protein
LPFDARARAGLERNLLDPRAAYVVKDPWLFSYCDQIDPGEVEVEALLVPVRELAASATSRILQERITMAESFWSDLQPSDVHGMVPGGAVYSLDPVDQARILAVGFHRLILWATTRRIPLFLLEFPRIVGDGEYLIDTLWPWLGEHCERDRAVEAFVSVADPGLVRVDGGQVRMPEDHALEAGQLDRAAMSVLLKERQVTLDATRRELAVAEQRLVDAERRLAEVRDELGASQHAAVEAEQAFVSRLAAVDAALAQRSIALGRTERARNEAVAQLAAVRGTWSWRLTRPLRALRGVGARSGDDVSGSTTPRPDR